MTLPQTATRNHFQVRLDELHQLSIALYAEAISNPSDAVVEKIEAITIEREQVYRDWETNWNQPAPVATTAAVIPAPATPATPGHTATKSAIIPAATKTIATKKLMLSLVSVKRITNDISASNFDTNELEIALKVEFGDRWLLHSPGATAPPAIITKLLAATDNSMRQFWPGG